VELKSRNQNELLSNLRKTLERHLNPFAFFQKEPDGSSEKASPKTSKKKNHTETHAKISKDEPATPRNNKQKSEQKQTDAAKRTDEPEKSESNEKDEDLNDTKQVPDAQEDEAESDEKTSS